MPRPDRSAYRDGRVTRAAMFAAALAGANTILPDMLNVHRKCTAQGVTIVVAPGDGPVTAEAWIGGGLGDEGHEPAMAGIAHLGEHVALAMAGTRARERCGGGGVGLDGWVTPDATVFRAIARAGAVGEAIAAVAEAACARGEVSEWVVAREREQIATEGTMPSSAGARDVQAWWARSYEAARTTVAVRGGTIEEAVAAVGDGWRRAGSGRRGAGDGRRVAVGGWRGRGVDVTRASARERAALAIAAAAMRARGDAADLIATRDVVLWVAAVAVHELALDEHQFAWARAAVRVPLAGVETAIGELAAGQHLFGDPGWGARWRAELARVSRGDVLAAVRTHVAGRMRYGARRAPVPPRRAPAPPRRPASRDVKRATLANGARVVAVRVPGADRVAVRVAWSGGFAEEGPAERGVVALLAAAAPTSCGAIDAAAETAALGGELAGVAGRWTFGLRSRWTTARWKDGLAVLTSCARSPALDHDVIARERTRLVALATDVAQSPSRVAFTTYLRARWGGDPLGIEALATPAELAALTRARAAQWWRAHYAPGAAVIVVAGDVDPDAAIAEVRAQLGAPPAPAAPRFAPATTRPATPVARLAATAALPALPAQRQLFVDGPGDTAALVIGLPGLPAADADRRALDGLVAILADPGGRLRRAVAAAGVRTLRVAAVDGPLAGYVIVELAGRPPADDALAAVESVIRALASDGPTAAEVARANAVLAPPDEPLAIADAIARAALRAPDDPPTEPAALDAPTLHRVAAAVLRWDDAMVVTVRPPAMTPGARAHAIKRVPPRRTRRGGRR